MKSLNGSLKKGGVLNNQQARLELDYRITFLVNSNEIDKKEIYFGSADKAFTPLYWKYICHKTNAIQYRERYKLGSSLLEEVIACILGGHGVKGEIGNMAFNAIKSSGLLDYNLPIKAKDIEIILKQPMMQSGHITHYRFPHQKAKYIEKAINFINTEDPPNGNGQLTRNWLLQIPGVGLKTASWIVRNWLNADDIAIIDIHIHRAGVLMDLFSPNEEITKNYLSMESRFIQLAEAIDIPTSVLDNIIWTEIRRTPNLIRKRLIKKGVRQTDKCGLPSPKNRHSNATYRLFA